MKPIYQELAKRLQQLAGSSDKFSEALEELRLHSEIIGNMAEGIYLISVDDGTILYTNPRFEHMFAYGPGEMIGKHVSIVNAPTQKDPKVTAMEIMAVLDKSGHWHGEVHNIKKDGTPFWCYANVSVFDHHRYGKVLIAVHADITDRKVAEEERERLLKELKDALANIRTLKGLIPICASCKKIRDDKGYWHQVEVYVRDHTNADFSHGYCPNCYKKMMGEIQPSVGGDEEPKR